MDRAGALRAERFEDEKRRIIDSCFSKKDGDGALLETYITHIRITEFSSHPSSPPPPQARTPETQKPRVIIVAVRRSGRVRMHKSKENQSGTFSIGKTWNLDDLSHIEAFTGPTVSADYREWGADTGFIVTLGKPYYWQAQTDKEKKFFVASLVKIYAKYTSGKVPELSGFDPKELDQVLGAGRRHASRPTTAAEQSPVASSSRSPAALPASQPMGSLPPPSSSPEPRFQKSPPVRPPMATAASPAASFDSGASSRDVRQGMPRWNANNKSQDSVANSMSRSDEASSIPPRSRNGMAGPGAFGRFADAREALPESPQEPPLPPPHLQAEERPPPERRRPPMDPSRPLDRDVVPPPLMSSGGKRDLVVPPPRSTDRTPPHAEPGTTVPGSLRARQVPPPALPSLATSADPEARQPEAASATKSNASQPSTPAIEMTSPLETAADDASERPGLGPMIKAKRSKGDIAGALWKAASAATAFRPRPGGAGERLRQAKAKTAEGPDGITSVVPAPPRPVSRDTRPLTPELSKAADSGVSAAAPVPEVQPPASEAIEKGKKEEPAKEDPRPSVVRGNDIKYLQSLGIDAKVLDDRSEEFGKWLDYLSWLPGEQMRAQTMDDVKAELDREINRAQAGGWLARFQEQDERVDAIKQGLDMAMAECDEMDNLLTLYSVELCTLSDDIAYIEAQGQGLQVQTANQKLLKKELESLLETCAITPGDLEALRLAPLESTRGLEEVEAALVTLFRAMIKMDPSLGGRELAPAGDGDNGRDQVLGLNSDYGQMRIVQEKKEMYLQESALFMRRLVEFMARQFDESYQDARRLLQSKAPQRPTAANYNIGREMLWRYSPLMLYARDVDLSNWNRLLQIYQDRGKAVYGRQVEVAVKQWREGARKISGEEVELLFTGQAEKQQEGVATTARKLTVKRSQTLARALRGPLGDSGRTAGAEKSGGDDGRIWPYEVFARLVEELVPLIVMEQNFVIDFFHATTLEHVDFAEAVAAFAPRERRGGDLRRHRLMEPDRELARRVTRSMEVIFVSVDRELQGLVDWAIGQDALQGVGVLAVLEQTVLEMSQSNQEFLSTVLQKLHSNLEGRFHSFIEEQLKAIEDTRVKMNKRRGIISFVRVFPLFMAAVENIMADVGSSSPGLRRTINYEYDRVLKSIFKTLKYISRERPAAPSVGTSGNVGGGAGDAEHKEVLNLHILLIENMNHLLEETETSQLQVLEGWREQALAEYREHLDLYVGVVTRRPLGKLLEQLENIETQLASGKEAVAVARQPSNSKASFNKVLGAYDAKEVRKGIEALRKRVEKHFGDVDEAGVGSGRNKLVGKVTQACEVFYTEVEGRIGRVITDVYGGEVMFEWPRSEVRSAFR
ncbi:hypothetical protein CDD81_875 [Ophiocordyceps australis]|uniref:Exocyst complex component Sec3 PIP2-binding N-terminal domain-containing protein n=1 Tax=Ophiocordyceps australis TaxID=1399860 RepID=A0A2C5YB45_9HYPO|nr:hypothetical protein CDD81_875 [Ophiocordyceps australis]